ncbi:transmembrane protein 231 isoform X2 [Dermacentor albipictus]|uniref:transmembrane protein 231 isoform X2 n=1 Tax=Dermacentor albipictus TaxID=60249 RepID=UPI0038FC81A6
MAVYTLFCEVVHRKYKASLCSKATVFVVVLSCATIVIPFIFAYKDLGFWKKLDQYQEQPEVRFKRRLIFILECGEGLVFWSSYPFLNSHATELSIPSVEDLEEDFDSDGKMDELNLSVKMPLPKKFDVLRVKILLLFDCRIATYTRVSYEGLAFIDHSSSISGSELSLTGELRLHQKELLRRGSHDSRFEHSIINLDSSSVSTFSLDFILDEYSKRNVTTQLYNVQSTWRAASGATHFLANLRIKYPVEILWYRPGVWQVLKHAWTQYLAFLAIFLLLGERTKEFVFARSMDTWHRFCTPYSNLHECCITGCFVTKSEESKNGVVLHLVAFTHQRFEGSCGCLQEEKQKQRTTIYAAPSGSGWISCFAFYKWSPALLHFKYYSGLK